MSAGRYAAAHGVDEHFLCPTLKLAARSQVQGWWPLGGNHRNGPAGKSRAMTTSADDGEILTILDCDAHFRGVRSRDSVVNHLSRKCHYIHKDHSHTKQGSYFVGGQFIIYRREALQVSNDGA